MKIVIIGSMRFYPKYEELKKLLEEKGHEVIIPKPDEFYSGETNIKRKAMEDFNINLEYSEAILVANFNDIGVNSIMEIGMAFNRSKKIFILNNIPENCKDELEAINCTILDGNLDNIL